VGYVMQDMPGALKSTWAYSSKAATNKDNASAWEWTSLVRYPLPKSQQGHVYALVMQDYFTKLPKVIPLKDTTIKSVAGALLSVILT